MEILPYTRGSVVFGEDKTRESGKRKPLEVQDPEDWCIFSVDVRNTYGIPFEVIFESDQSGERTRDQYPLRTLMPIMHFRRDSYDRCATRIYDSVSHTLLFYQWVVVTLLS